jgi:hypothetical protein
MVGEAIGGGIEIGVPELGVLEFDRHRVRRGLDLSLDQGTE